MITENVKGFKDYIGKDAEKRAEIKKILIEIFEKYGFEPAETPVIEYEEFVKGNNPNDEAVSDIFKLKEERLTFMEKDLINLFDFAGFNNVKSKVIYLRQMSVKNWLEGNNLTLEMQEKIFNLHKYAKPYFKQDYCMIETPDDCFIDMKVVIVTGVK